MSIRLGFIFFILIAAIGDCHAQIPGFFMKEEKHKVSIPFLSSNGLIIVAVAINGNTPLNFLVDTGVRSNILFSKKLGDTLALEYTRRIKLIGADGTANLMASVSPINHFDLGPVEGKLQSLLVLEEDFFELESVIGVPVYGILGYEFFKFNPIKIDYEAGVLDFYEAKAMKWKPLFYRKLKMEVEDSKPYIQAKVKQIGGRTLEPKLLIDTGANHGLLLNRETTEQIKLPSEKIEAALGQGLGGVLYGFIGRVDYLKFANFKLKDVLTSYPEETVFSHIIKSSGRQGSLGAEILERTKLIFDYPRNRLLVAKADNFYQPFEYDMSGIVIKKVPNDDNRMYVSSLRKGSPADHAGIQPFDEIMSINTIPTFIWDLSEVTQLLRSEDGKEIKLEVRRYEGDDLKKWNDFTVSFILKKQI